MQDLLQNIINGLSQGSVYALVALGYTMVYGVLQFINFAHSDIFMLGAFGGLYASLFLSFLFGNSLLSPWAQFFLVTTASMILCIVVSLLIERVAYRPLRSSPRLNVLITAIGVSLLLENLGQVVFGSDPKVFPSLIPTESVFTSENFTINNIQIIVIAVSVFLMLGLHWIIQHTKVGMAMRAISYDVDVASLMGIPINHVISITFAIGAALAGSASILYGLSYPKIEPLLGIMIGLKAFVAAVFGGIGNIVGAAVGGILIGLAESFVVYYLSSSFRDAIAFAILIFILLFRPAGLFGKFQKEKV